MADGVASFLLSSPARKTETLKVPGSTGAKAIVAENLSQQMANHGWQQIAGANHFIYGGRKIEAGRPKALSLGKREVAAARVTIRLAFWQGAIVTESAESIALSIADVLWRSNVPGPTKHEHTGD